MLRSIPRTVVALVAATTPLALLPVPASAQWIVEPSPTTQWLRAVSVVSPDDVFAVGDHGTVAHWNGIVWATQTFPTTADLTHVAGASATEVYALGDETVYRYDGSTWTVFDTPSHIDVAGLWVSPSGKLWVYGQDNTATFLGFVYSWTGSEWSSPYSIDMSNAGALVSLWGPSDTELFATASGSRIYHLGSTCGNGVFSMIEYQANTSWGAIWGRSADDVYAAWDDAPGWIHRFDGVYGPGCDTEWAYDAGSSRPMRGLWGSAEAGMYAVGDQTVQGQTRLLILHKAPGSDTWEPMTTPMDSEPGSWLWSVHGSDPQTVYAVGQLGLILRLTTEPTGALAGPPSNEPELRTWPNPSTDRATIEFSLDHPADVTLSLHDVTGRRVATLLRAQRRESGTFEETWDGRATSGGRLASGVYFLRLQAGGEIRTQRIVRLDP